MPAYLVSYDLMKQGKDYTSLINKIERDYSMRSHILGSTWLIRSESSASIIRDNLISVMDSNDKIIVAKLDDEAAWMNLNDDGGVWLTTVLNNNLN